MKKEFRSFKDARTFVHQLNLKNTQEWRNYCKSDNKPENVPSIPMRTYKKDWKSMGDWLGTGYVANKNRNYQSFQNARKFVQSLQLNYFKDWKIYCKSGNKPDDIPSNVQNVYNKEWTSWGDFLGTGYVYKKDFRNFDSARKFVRKLKFKNRDDWKKFMKSSTFPSDIPRDPTKSYKEWTSWGDFLGTGTIQNQNKKYRSFEDARRFVQSLGLKNTQDWRKYGNSGNKPNDIPWGPYLVYKKEWTSMGDWLGTGIVANQIRSKNYLSFTDAKIEARKLAIKYNLKTLGDWEKAVREGKIPKNIPLNPRRAYAKKRKR